LSKNVLKFDPAFKVILYIASSPFNIWLIVKYLLINSSVTVIGKNVSIKSNHPSLQNVLEHYLI
jgi:hypothetical protein